MATLKRLISLVILAALASPALAGTLLVATIHGTINPGTSAYLGSAVARASRENAEALVVELDTPGGLLSSVREMIQTIDASRVPVVVYVHPAGSSATSAGALLLLGSHFAAMAPGTNAGAAHPVGGGGEEIKGTMGEKVLSDTTAFARGLADLRGRNRELAEAIVSKSRSFTADEALKEHLIDSVSPSIESLAETLDGRAIRIGPGNGALVAKPHTRGAAIVRHEMTFGQSILAFLANPNISGILMTAGLLLLYLEFSHPGLVVPGVAGALCLLTAFVALQLLPIRAGAAALLAAGIVMFVLEPFVVSHGSLAAGGIVAFVLGLIWLIDPSASSMSVSPAVWMGSALALGMIAAAIGFALRRMSRNLERTRASIGGGSVSGLSGYTGTVETVEAGGLRGRALFRGELWDFSAETPLRPGDPVEAIESEGLRVRVRPKESK